MSVYWKKQYRSMNTFRSKKHNICTEKITKIALSADDDKRTILENELSTLALGHHINK